MAHGCRNKYACCHRKLVARPGVQARNMRSSSSVTALRRQSRMRGTRYSRSFGIPFIAKADSDASTVNAATGATATRFITAMPATISFLEIWRAEQRRRHVIITIHNHGPDRRCRRTPCAPCVPTFIIVSSARAATPDHARHLYQLGATDAVPETVEASLQLFRIGAGGARRVPMGPVIASIHEKRRRNPPRLAGGCAEKQDCNVHTCGEAEAKAVATRSVLTEVTRLVEHRRHRQFWICQSVAAAVEKAAGHCGTGLHDVGNHSDRSAAGAQRADARHRRNRQGALGRGARHSDIGRDQGCLFDVGAWTDCSFPPARHAVSSSG